MRTKRDIQREKTEFALQIIRVNPEQKSIVKTVVLPVTQTTSMAWGGPEMQTLFVTTSRRNLQPSELRRQALAGRMFVLHDMPHRGVPGAKFVFPDADQY